MATDPPISKALVAQFNAARRRAAADRRTKPHAKAVRFNRRTRQVEITLLNDAMIGIPVAMLPRLAHATDAQLSDVEPSMGGTGIRFEQIDEDYSVMPLVVMALGKKAVSQAAASIAGSHTSPAKAAAARRNGRKGGRPAGR